MTAARIALIDASLSQTDPCRAVAWPHWLEVMLNHRGMQDAIVRSFCRDGLSYYGARWDVSPYDDPGSIGAKVVAFKPTHIIVGMAINDALFGVDPAGTDIQEQASAFVSDLKPYVPVVDGFGGMFYLSIQPPNQFTYNGKSYTTSATGWQVFDTFLRALYGPNVLSMNYALVVSTLAALKLQDTLDGIHPAFGAPYLMAGLVYDSLVPFAPDLESPNYLIWENLTAMLQAASNPTDPNYTVALQAMTSIFGPLP